MPFHSPGLFRSGGYTNWRNCPNYFLIDLLTTPVACRDINSARIMANVFVLIISQLITLSKHQEYLLGILSHLKGVIIGD